MKSKLTLIIILVLIKTSSFAQLSTLISNFKPAYAKGDVKNYINDGEYIVSNLGSEEKSQGQRILTLFKVLTGNKQDLTTTDFNKAMSEIGLSSLIEKNINPDLTLISVKWGAYKSYLVFNQSKKLYKFSLKGLFKTVGHTASNNFDGGIYEYHCRIVTYSTSAYSYTVASVKEIPTIF